MVLKKLLPNDSYITALVYYGLVTSRGMTARAVDALAPFLPCDDDFSSFFLFA